MEKAAALDSTSPQTRAFLFMMIIDSIILYSSLFHLTHSFMTLVSFLLTAWGQAKSQSGKQLGTAETRITSNLNERDRVDDDDEEVSTSELRIVLGRLGTSWNGHKQLRVRADDITAMFEEQEPSVVEAKEAFDVFDENGDGFIDAGELRRVLFCRLGCSQASSENNCKEMIRAFDENGDGLVDFHEFLKLVNTSFA
ncbi:Probable calcium-binding protein CML45 [Linum perenne]